MQVVLNWPLLSKILVVFHFHNQVWSPNLELLVIDSIDIFTFIFSVKEMQLTYLRVQKTQYGRNMYRASASGSLHINKLSSSLSLAFISASGARILTWMRITFAFLVRRLSIAHLNARWLSFSLFTATAINPFTPSFFFGNDIPLFARKLLMFFQ